jgi:hypothetical protein
MLEQFNESAIHGKTDERRRLVIFGADPRLTPGRRAQLAYERIHTLLFAQVSV